MVSLRRVCVKSLGRRPPELDFSQHDVESTPRKKGKIAAYDTRNINTALTAAPKKTIVSLPDACVLWDTCGGIPHEIRLTAEDDISQVSLEKGLREMTLTSVRPPTPPRPSRHRLFARAAPPPPPVPLCDSNDWPSDEEDGMLSTNPSKSRSAAAFRTTSLGLCGIHNLFPQSRTLSTEENTDTELQDDGSAPLLSRRQRSFPSSISSYSHSDGIAKLDPALRESGGEGREPASTGRNANSGWERFRC